MWKLKFKLDRKAFQTIFIAFIRPLLEYGDIIWDNCSQCEKQELGKVQIEAAIIATGTTKLISLNSLYTDIGWQTLQQRRTNHKLTLFYKIKNNLSPTYCHLWFHSLLTAFHATILEMQTIHNLLHQELPYTICLFYHLLLEIGIFHLKRLNNLILSSLLKAISTGIEHLSPNTMSEAENLRFSIPAFVLTIAAQITICF